MSDLRKAAEMALKALEELRFANAPFLDEAMEALRQALAQPEQECTCSVKDMPFGKCCKAQPEQEPVAWMYALNDNVGEIARTVVKERFNLSVTSPYGREGIDYAQGMTVKEFPLYTAPPKREWVGLTDEQFSEACRLAEQGNYLTAFRRIQAYLKENNT